MRFSSSTADTKRTTFNTCVRRVRETQGKEVKEKAEEEHKRIASRKTSGSSVESEEAVVSVCPIPVLLGVFQLSR
ncbi:hypothetical protein CKAN_00032900 [Cinnamomum micranthum f. kanehirae]|uniref:Uncharacterized protein n=1 Tax=Cinnamomum micranthum f. kanehirae TaxID=337451 RepID=A0A443N0R8_9MAGN|nr:hypothetical protein CKAN_00032900 [Cinnamomum micranthum f. kanehirae]